MYVVLAGPDGCGKSTVAQRLTQEAGDVVHRHWRPGLLPALDGLLGRARTGVNQDPHGRQPDRRLKAALRTIYYWLDFVLGYAILIRRSTKQGHIFLVERGWDDVTIDPLRYGLRGPALAQLLARYTPKPDITLVLDLDPAIARQRKPEISEQEIARQLQMWKRLKRRNVIVLDASQEIDDVCAKARAEVERHLKCER